MTSGDPDLDIIIDEFVAESCEGLDMAVDDVLSLEQGLDQEAIDRIFRVVHTIKGTASMLNFNALSEFVHCLEDTCSDIRSGNREVNKQVADGLLKCLDFIQAKLDYISDTYHEEGDCSLGEVHLRALREAPRPKAEARPKGIFLDLSEDDRDTPPAASGMDTVSSPAGSNKGSKALIVEDDFVTRNMLHAFLSRFMSCYVAKDGSEAIQAVTQSYAGPNPEPFSLILMDVMMPVIDGLQATRAIRELERAKGAGRTHAEAKIFMATAMDDRQTMRKAIHECGADTYMVKPLDFEEMMRLIARHQLLSPAPTQATIQEKQCA